MGIKPTGSTFADVITAAIHIQFNTRFGSHPSATQQPPFLTSTNQLQPQYSLNGSENFQVMNSENLSTDGTNFSIQFVWGKKTSH
jgi:hypothetical protein